MYFLNNVPKHTKPFQELKKKLIDIHKSEETIIKNINFNIVHYIKFC